jgi:hypothetical protein
MWWKCFVFLYGNRTMKSVEVVLGKEEGGTKEKDGGLI